jgi:hypothetical protein
MRKSNVKTSQAKQKRYQKNKKRTSGKPHLSKFERQQIALRESIIAAAFPM